MMPRNGQTGCRPSIRAGVKVKERKNKKDKYIVVHPRDARTIIVPRTHASSATARQAKRSVQADGAGQGKKRASPVGTKGKFDPPALPSSTDARSSRKIKIRFTPESITSLRPRDLEIPRRRKGKQDQTPIRKVSGRQIRDFTKKPSHLDKAVRRFQQVRRRRKAIQQGLIPAPGLQVPERYDPLMAQNICDRYADGEPMLSILATPGYPRGGEFYLWTETIPELEKKWTAARRARAHSLAEETLHISDQSLKDHPAFIPAHTLRVKTRQWLAAKARPETYGEHQSLHHTGQLSIAAMSQQLKTVNPPELIDSKTGRPYEDPE